MSDLTAVSLEWMNERISVGLPALLGIEFVAVEPARLESRMEVGPQHMAPNGFLHAAAVIALADTSCGMGTVAALGGTASFTTVELKSNFLGTATSGHIECEATPVHLGRTTHVWDARVQRPDCRVIALFRCTQLVLEKHRPT